VETKNLNKKKILIILSIAVGSAIILGGVGYVGASYYQVEKLIEEGDRLRGAGDYVAAENIYDQAQKKQIWPSKKSIESKLTEVNDLIADDNSFKAGNAAFGNGEWQKCLEYFNQVTGKYPKHGESQNRYSDCQKKIGENATAPEVSDATKTWKVGGSVIGGAFADADVVTLGNGQHRMYYSVESETPDFHGQVYSAISSDGINWIQEAGERKSLMTFPDVVSLPDGRFRMYFQNRNHVIASAISSDGLNFTDEPGVRVDAVVSGYTVDEIGGQSTMILPDGTYLMVYGGLQYNKKWSDNVPNDKVANSFYATSKDGLSWTKRGLAVSSDNNTLRGWLDGAELVNFDGQIRLYFWSYFGIYYVEYSNGEFSSKLVADFPNYLAPGREYPEDGRADPSVIKLSNKWFLYFGQHTKGISYATK